MFCINKNYNEVGVVHYEYIPKFLIKQTQFLMKCWKMCPNCGAILKIDAPGCDNCLFQFNKTCQGLRRNNDEQDNS